MAHVHNSLHCHVGLCPYDTDEPADVDQPVTVADLLDAHDNDSPGFPDVNGRRASATVWRSFCDVSNVLAEYRSLSPSERAEFDRRTT